MLRQIDAFFGTSGNTEVECFCKALAGQGEHGLFQRHNSAVHWLQLRWIHDLVLLEVVDTCVGDEIEFVAQNRAHCRTAQKVRALFKRLARNHLAPLRRELPVHHAILSGTILRCQEFALMPVQAINS